MIFIVLFIFIITTILLSIVLEKLFNSPILVAITFLSINLIIVTTLFVTGVITDFALGILIAILFAIISYITAVISRFIGCVCKRYLAKCCTRCPVEESVNDSTNCCNSNGKLLTISCRCNNGNSQDILSINSNCLESGDNDNNCSVCNRNAVIEENDEVRLNDTRVITDNTMNNMHSNIINRGYFRR